MTKPDEHASVSEPLDLIDGGYDPAITKALSAHGIVVQNEFAKVEVEPLEVPGGSLLLIRDARNGQTIVVDALELESLTRLKHADFADLVNPSREPNYNGSSSNGRP